MKKRSLFISALAIGVVGAGTAVALPSPGPITIGALSKGPVVAPSATLRASLDGLQSFGPDASKAHTIASPDGAQWTVLPAANDGVCVAFNNDRSTVACGAGDGVRNGRFGIVEIAKPSPAEEARQAAARKKVMDANPGSATLTFNEGPPHELTAAVRKGITPDGIATVQALNADGDVVSQAPVQNNAYVLQLGLEGTTQSIRLVKADGSTAATSPLN